MRLPFLFLVLLLFLAWGGLPQGQASAAGHLPAERVFVNPAKFAQLVERAHRENWRALPLGQRTARVGLALVGTPYVNYTLELDDHLEAPCVNFDGMDCWTFFEIALGTARALALTERPTPKDLLRMIELERYRGGRCDGTFVSRLHHLEDWAYDNQKRGLIADLTPGLPGATPLRRSMQYMAKNWHSFRQLRANPQWVARMAEIEEAISQRGLLYLPKNRVAAIEKYLQDGDVIAIVTTWPGTYTSHVGLAVRDAHGVLRFLHASRNHRQVILDDRLSVYLAKHKRHQGIFVSRPLEVAAAR